LVTHSPRIDNQPITFKAVVVGGDPELNPTYDWSVTGGKIISGQGTSNLVVDIANLGSQSITATVSLSGLDPACTIPQASIVLLHKL
jgi:hypothetical protein